ncbi:type II toxin-antitoxin system PemK/MazF family toxin [Candidatus Sumerlaeota bacterium]|nr:type II toxin-antitoxin system PemK/MazF family toxin [Candidatus Sumerlaeota bacterium]
MVSPSAGSVVLVTFPFSDLSASKSRPAVVLASSGRGDWILCQVTSSSYEDPNAIKITDKDFISGSLLRISFARPGKLFTANISIIISEVGILHPPVLESLRKAVINILSG